MTTSAKRKGDKAELEAARLLADRTGWPVRRKLGAGRADDTGDLDGIPDCVCQVKAYRDITRAIREILDELPAQQTNAGADYAFGLVRRPGGRWFAVLDLDNLCALLREATEPTVEDLMPIIIGEDQMPDHSTRRGQEDESDVVCNRGQFQPKQCQWSDLDPSWCNEHASYRHIPGLNHPTRRAIRHAAGIE